MSNEKVLRKIDLAILIIAVSSFILIAIGAIYMYFLNKVPPVDVNWVALFMMLSMIFLYGLKLLVSEKTQIAFQLILLVIVLVASTSFVAIAKRMLFAIGD